MNYIPKGLTEEIRKKVAVAKNPKNSPLFDFFCRKRRIKEIRKNAQIHSYRIENPDGGVPYSVPKKNGSVKRGIKCIENAFNWGKENFDIKKFDESFIKKLAGKILPELYCESPMNYRQMHEGVRISGSKFLPPYPAKVREVEMPRFIDCLRYQFKNTEEDVIAQLMVAIYAHFHLVRIHPFTDGNGRTARTLQDVILDHYHLPIPLIEAGERMTYYQCLEQAVEGWKEKGASDKKINGATSGEQMFYTFIAGKINSSLDKMIGYHSKF